MWNKWEKCYRFITDTHFLVSYLNLYYCVNTFIADIWCFLYCFRSTHKLLDCEGGLTAGKYLDEVIPALLENIPQCCIIRPFLDNNFPLLWIYLYSDLHDHLIFSHWLSFCKVLCTIRCIEHDMCLSFITEYHDAIHLAFSKFRSKPIAMLNAIIGITKMCLLRITFNACESLIGIYRVNFSI